MVFAWWGLKQWKALTEKGSQVTMSNQLTMN